MRLTMCLALALACGPRENAPPHVTLPTRVAHGVPATPREAPDLLRCPLRVETYELGEKGDGAPSAPVATANGFVVAFNHGSSLVTQRLDGAGVLEDPVVFGDAGLATPLLALDRGVLSPLADALPGVGGEAWPDDWTGGPRGPVATFIRGDQRTVVTPARVVGFSVAGPHPMPTEQVLASGPDADVVVLRGAPIRVGVVPASGGSVVHALGVSDFVDVSIAGGERGFLVIGDGSGMMNVTTVGLDRSGVPSSPNDLPRVDDTKVTRFPRAAALASGWVVTYWDGIGPSLVRIDSSARETSPPIELRTGDERGGQTEARIAVSGRAIAVTWVVGQPWWGHGVASEIPNRPGPRLAVISCR